MSTEIEPFKEQALDHLAAAVQAGLDPQAVSIMRNNLDKVTLAGGQGRGLDSLQGDSVVLVTLVIDESMSMNNVADLVKRYYMKMLHSLRKQTGVCGVMLSTWVFNDTRKLKNSFRPVQQAPSNIDSYQPEGMTHLYDTVTSVLTSQVVYTQEVWGKGKVTKNVVVVLSDGEDNTSPKDPTGVSTKELAETLREQGDYILAYVGFSDKEPLSMAECRRLADRIGFDEVFAASKTDEDIERIFTKITAGIVRLSQSTEVERTEGFFD